MQLHFFRQQRDYWCGPACVQMLVSHYRTVVPTQRSLAKHLGTNPRTGTSRRAIVAYLRKAGFHVQARSNGTLRNLQQALQAHAWPMVLYQETDTIEPETNGPHYAVVISVTKTAVTLRDPSYGRNFTLSRSAFRRNWNNPKAFHRSTGWFASVTR
jgi:predicted double-glycine peptidase